MTNPRGAYRPRRSTVERPTPAALATIAAAALAPAPWASERPTLTRSREERKVAMVVVFFPISRDEPKLEPARLEELAKLGIADVALVRGPAVAGLVLEGWAFDAGDAQRAVRAVVGATEGVRTLQPLVQMAVSSAAARGGDG